MKLQPGRSSGARKTFIPVLLLAVSVFSCVKEGEPLLSQQGKFQIPDRKEGDVSRIYPLRGNVPFQWIKEPATGSKSASGMERPIDRSWRNMDSRNAAASSSGLGIYRFTIQVPEAQGPYGIWLGRQNSAFEIIVNSQRQAGAGNVAVQAKAMEPALSRPLVVLNAGSNEIELRVSNFQTPLGGPMEESMVGSLQSLRRAELFLALRQMLVFGSMVVGSVFFLIIFLAWPADRSFFYFFWIALFAGLRASLTGSLLGYELFPHGYEIFAWMEFSIDLLIAPIFLYFLLEFLKVGGLLLLKRSLLIVPVLISTASIFIPVAIYSKYTIAAQVFSGGTALIILIILAREILKFRREAMLVGAAFLVLLFALANDFFRADGLDSPVHYETGSLGFLFFLFPIAVMLGRRTAKFSKKNFELSTELRETNEALRHFVPEQFLSFLSDDIRSVRLGQVVETQVTVMFVDIRNFTRLSENMGPEKTMQFLNEYLSRVGPMVNEKGGFIDKFLGDGLLALFPGSADSALECAIRIQKEISTHNDSRMVKEGPPVNVVVALSTGRVALGTVGFSGRMDTTVIGDTVNLAARLESLSKKLGSGILMSAATVRLLKNDCARREIDYIQIRGKKDPVTVYECFEADPPHLKEQKSAATGALIGGLALKQALQYREAYHQFVDTLRIAPADPIIAWHIEKCQAALVREKMEPEKNRILYVEDNVITEQVLRRRLGPLYEITTVGTIAEAMEEVRANQFDILISDMHLPDGDGPELIRSVRSSLGAMSANLELYILTADSSQQAKDQAMNVNCRLFLKPDGLKELVQLIKAESQSK